MILVFGILGLIMFFLALFFIIESFLNTIPDKKNNRGIDTTKELKSILKQFKKTRFKLIIVALVHCSLEVMATMK